MIPKAAYTALLEIGIAGLWEEDITLGSDILASLQGMIRLGTLLDTTEELSKR